jgi:hypothetical protein
LADESDVKTRRHAAASELFFNVTNCARRNSHDRAVNAARTTQSIRLHPSKAFRCQNHDRNPSPAGPLGSAILDWAEFGDEMSSGLNLLTELETHDEETGDLVVIIETPKNCRSKYAYDKKKAELLL